MERILFNHCHLVVDGKREYLDGALLVDGETIEDVFVNGNMIKNIPGEYEEIDLKGKIVMPGFFDTHCHGIKNVDFNKCCKQDISKASEEYAKHGTTSFYTTLTNDENYYDTLDTLNDCNTEYARHLGVHLEGPFISKDSRGVLKEETILDCDLEKLNEILSHNSKVRQMTIAPEKEHSKELIDELRKRNIKVMFGHSKAKQKDCVDKQNDGYTHLFNAMSGFSHRDLGLVNMAFNDKNKYCELICDGHHIDLSVLSVALNNLRKDRIIIISDSTKMAGLDDGEFIFEGSKCMKKGTLCYKKDDGKIAGSAAFIVDGLKTMRKAGASLSDLLLMSSLNAYRLYGLDNRFGSLIKGKYADVVILDEELNVVNTYVRGKLINA